MSDSVIENNSGFGISLIFSALVVDSVIHGNQGGTDPICGTCRQA